jgi:hypothetical protein
MASFKLNDRDLECEGMESVGSPKGYNKKDSDRQKGKTE